MAVVWIWDVKGRLDHPIDYAINPLKTMRINGDEGSYQSLRDVMDYASNDHKTYDTDLEHYVSSINCNTQTARKEMILTKKQYCDESSLIAFHGFQSFRPDETTPETAHQIGLELAQKMWGDRFQVIVATHLNTQCIHNHFVLNSTSFLDGKRYYDNKANLQLVRKLSDEICRAYQLSVIEQPQRIKTNHYMTKADKAGMPTRYNITRQAIDEAITCSFSLDDFHKQLQQMGYECKLNPNHKYWTIIPMGWNKPIRLYKLGSEYEKDKILERISVNSLSMKYEMIQKSIKQDKYLPQVQKRAKKIGGLRGLYLHYAYRLGVLPKSNKINPARLHYLLKDDLMKLNQISSEVRFLFKYHINTKDELLSFHKALKLEEISHISQRKKLWNQTRNITNKETLCSLKNQITNLSKRCIQIRKEVRLCEGVVSRSISIEKNLEAIQKEENIGKEKLENESRRRRGRTTR